MIVFAIMRDAVERRRLEVSLGEGFIAVEQIDALWTKLDGATPRGFVLELGGPHCRELLPVIGVLRSHHPTAPIVGYSTLSAGTAQEIVFAIRAGVTSIALRDLNDLSRTLHIALADASLDDAASRSLPYLFAELPCEFHAFATLCVHQVRASGRVTDIASSMNLPARTLLRRLERSRLPTPGVLIAWVRILMAAHMIQNEQHTVAHVSTRLGLGSPLSFRALLRRHTGMRPTEVRQVGGLRKVLTAFRAALTTESGRHQRKAAVDGSGFSARFTASR